MSRLLIIVLLLWLPFQFAWGAAASYCQHEQAASVSHFGHHSHKHQGKSLQCTGDATPDKKTSIADEDLDCDYCHISCAQPLAPVMLGYQIEPVPHAAPGTCVQGHSPNVPDLIERPKWTLAA
ncbi:cation efflux protein, CzcI family [Methylibium sp.]|uniref:cation efflux protein, CzcI family n=1 Tax=Methylibium sp. TaxID=2067992 RepID=UPI003D09F66C